MDPHLMLLVFLPILLFESAFALDMGVLRKQMTQVTLMASAGVVVASLLTALLIQYGLEPTWAFNVCWLIGTITSATDPVAVVALLKELGTDKAIGTLIEGESLLNDGSAVVLYAAHLSLQLLCSPLLSSALSSSSSLPAPFLPRYVVIKNWIEHLNSDLKPYDSIPGYPEGGYTTWVDLIRLLLQMLVLGIILGAFWGAVLCRTLRSVYNDVIIEIALTIGCSYLCFWSAEMLLSSSAVIAVVIMGFYVNYRQASAISPEV